MLCFNCGLKLHKEEETECQVCGVRFNLKCRNCNFPNPEHANFCVNCGAKLMEALEKSAVQNYEVLNESRKNVAVIFADVSGFTALSEVMDPEEVREIINECFNRITKPVYELDGSIDKYMGDCVMILFGASRSHTDDSKRAVMCAIRMLDIINEFSDHQLSGSGLSLKLSLKGLSLKLSIGINFGLVVTGSVGNYFDKDYTVMGDIVNTAQRLQQSAGAGSILVSESVFNETRDIIDYSPPKELTLKNKEKPVICYSPLRINSDYFFEQQLIFLERENEIRLLNSVYNEALNTRTRFVKLIGEAGLGKTRLVKEFTAKVGDGAKTVWVACSPASQSRVYHLISSILMNLMNISRGDTHNVRQHRLLSFVEYILSGADEAEVRRNCNFLGLLLGMRRDNDFNNLLSSMNHENIRNEIIKQLVIFFERLCAKSMTVIVADDIHWADNASCEILTGLFNRLPEAKLVVMSTSRYESGNFKDMDKDRLFEIKLQKLSKGAMERLACKILGCIRMDLHLAEIVNAFANGNPLYLREFIQNILRSGHYYIKKDTAYLDREGTEHLPPSLQSLIMSNFSMLDAKSRAFIEAAATAGKEFSYNMILKLFDGMSDGMFDSLFDKMFDSMFDSKENDINITEAVINKAEKLNLISLKTVAATKAGGLDRIFSFNHEADREVIYDSILNKRKKELHKRLGESIEINNAKNLEDYYESLCHHFTAAGLNQRAANYHYMAAEKYREAYDLQSATEHYVKYIALMESSEKEQISMKMASALTEVAGIYFLKGDYEKASNYINKVLLNEFPITQKRIARLLEADILKETGKYEEALDRIEGLLHETSADNSFLGRLLYMKCSVLRITGNPSALSTAKQSEKALLKAKDYYYLAEIINQAGLIYFMNYDTTNAFIYLNKAYKYAERIENLQCMAKVSGNLGLIYHETGMTSKALEQYDISTGLSARISDNQLMLSGIIKSGIIYLEKGNYDKAEELFDRGLSISRDISSRLNECICLSNIGEISLEKVNLKSAEKNFIRSLHIAKELNLQKEQAINHLGLAKVNIVAGRLYDAENHFREVQRLTENFEEKGLTAETVLTTEKALTGETVLSSKKGLTTETALARLIFADAYGDFDNAIKYGTDVLLKYKHTNSNTNSTIIKIKNILAGIYEKKDMSDKAMKLYNEIVIDATRLEYDRIKDNAAQKLKKLIKS